MTTITNNPFECGKKLKTGFDYFAKGFCKNGLVDAHYRLIADRRQAQLLLECASFEEIDEHYNPGEYDDESDRLTTDMVLEAVRVRQFGQTAKTMAALQRVLNKHLAATGKLVNDEPMFAGDAIIGKPKKSGLFASVTVQFPINDGQTLSIIFHSPDNNKMKITAADEIIAFRWLLNKRDITSAVAPDSAEEGTLPGMAAAKDVSLEEVGIRCAQLIAKNSDRFAAKSAEIQQAKKELEEIKGQVDQLQGKNSELQDNLAAMQNDAAKTDSQISATQKQLDAQVNYNDELRAKLDALKATGAGNAGKEHGEDTTGGVSKADQETAEFEAKKAAFGQELDGRGMVASSDGAYSLNTGNGGGLSASLFDGADGFTARVSQTVVGANPESKEFSSKTLSGLDAQITKALNWIDKKLGEMKGESGTEEKYQAAVKVFENAITEMGLGRSYDGTFRIELVTTRNGKPFVETVSANQFFDEGKGSVVVNAAKQTFTARSKDTAENAFDKGIAALQEALKDRETVAQWTEKYQAAVNKFKVGEEYKMSRQAFVSKSFDLTEYMEGYKVTNLNSTDHGGSMLPAIEFQSDSTTMNVRYDLLQGYLDTKAIVSAIAPETTNPDAAGDDNPDRAEENAAVTILNDIIAGKYGMDRKAIDAALDEAAATLEKLGMMELYDDRLNQAADELTRVLKEAAKGVA